MVQSQLMPCSQDTGITGSLRGMLLGLKDDGPSCMMSDPRLGTPHGVAGVQGGQHG